MQPIQASLKNRLIITYWNFTAGVTISVTGFGRNRQGSFVFLNSVHILNSLGTSTEIVIPVFEGIMEVVTISTQNTLQMGDCYITADMWSGSSTSNGFLFANLIGNYLTQSRALSWPLSEIISPEEGVGRNVFETVADPAVQTNFTFTPAANRLYEIIAISYRLITDGNAASREALLHINPAGVDSFFVPPTSGISAGVTRNLLFGRGVNIGVTTTTVIGNLPTNIIIDAKSPISSSITLMQVGDQIDQIQIHAIRKITV